MRLQRQTYFSVSSVGVPIRNTADYSPFGVQLDGRTIQGDFYRLGFNGMEKDDEVKGGGNSYSTEFRQYDVRLGRWLSLDPMMAKFPWQSPYCAMDNNPISLVDPLGSESEEKGGGDEPKQTIGTEKNPIKLNEVPISPTTGMAGFVAETKKATTMKITSTTSKNESNSSLQGVNLDAFAEGFCTPMNQFDINLSEKKPEHGSDLDNWSENLGSAISLTVNWFAGTNYEKSEYNNNRIANSMKNAWRVNQARNFYYKKYENETNLANTQVTGFNGKFGLLGVLHAGFDPIEQFVGSCRINIYNENGNSLKFVITNQTSMNSLLYDTGPSWYRDSFSPGGNAYQTFIWSEPVRKR